MKSKGIDGFGEMGVDERAMLKLIFKEQCVLMHNGLM
jgi:hypothetical protein